MDHQACAMGLGPQFICLFTFRGEINLERLTTDLMTLAESQSFYSGETPIYAFASDHLYIITSGKKQRDLLQLQLYEFLATMTTLSHSAFLNTAIKS